MNPALGVFFHWLGGLASASFYVPYRGVKHWAWETYWLVGGFFSWIIAPWILALTMTHDLMGVLHEAPASSLLWAYIFGVLWGLGGLTFGLTMRYLGMSLGMAMVLGYTAAFGTLMPPIFRGVFASEVLGTRSGLVILGGVAVCLLGIAVAGAAGVSKEREMSTEQKRASIKEFDLKKGLLVATFSGVMSACFAYGLAAGDPIKAITIQHGTPVLWQGLPVLVVVLAGGFTTNFIWCLILNIRNRTGHQYFVAEIRGAEPAGQLVDAVHGGTGPLLERDRVRDVVAVSVGERDRVAAIGLLLGLRAGRTEERIDIEPFAGVRVEAEGCVAEPGERCQLDPFGRGPGEHRMTVRGGARRA